MRTATCSLDGGPSPLAVREGEKREWEHGYQYCALTFDVCLASFPGPTRNAMQHLASRIVTLLFDNSLASLAIY